jgi:DNA replication and repair protein RecF
VCLALTGRSPRTRSEREVIAFGEPLARVEVEVERGEEMRAFLWSVDRAGRRRHLVDRQPARQGDLAERPAVSIFLPDRLALVKGPPALRRAHLDRLGVALWPAREGSRRRYARALAQRNALLARVRANGGSLDSLEAWDRELALSGAELMACRRDAVTALQGEFRTAAAELGLRGEARLAYRPRSESRCAEGLRSELVDRRAADLRRGYSGHGPHLDDLGLSLEERSLRVYGSQGEQRAALLALLFAEHRVLVAARRVPPVMLLDDVMSELDATCRGRLARRLREDGGQALVTATGRDHLPAGLEPVEVAVRGGRVIADTPPNPWAPRASPVPQAA